MSPTTFVKQSMKVETIGRTRSLPSTNKTKKYKVSLAFNVKPRLTILDPTQNERNETWELKLGQMLMEHH